MKIPWKLKSRLFKILTYFPSNTLYLVQQHITRQAKVRVTEPYIGWEHHRKIIEMTGASRVIEFGAGKSLVQNLYLAVYAESQTVVDLFPMIDIDLVNEAVHQLGSIGAEIDGRPASSVKLLKDIYNIRYLAPFNMLDTGFDDNSFDLCISTNTLEHIPAADIRSIFIELRRLLGPNGNVSAMIDYSDHYAHSDPSIGRLNYLQFTAKEWEKHNHHNHYQNRLRHLQYGEIFKSAGFEPVTQECTDYCDPAGLDLVDDLLTGDQTDFATTGFWHLKAA